MSWLTNHTIERLIQGLATAETRRAFLGVFPLNGLPRYIHQRPAFLVVNTRTNDLPGDHWLCLLLLDDGRGEVFNSTGLPPPTLIARWMNRMARVWTYNEQAYQSPGSATCGAYCVYVILHRLQYPTLSQTLQPFLPDPLVNDRLMTRYFRIIKDSL